MYRWVFQGLGFSWGLNGSTGILGFLQFRIHAGSKEILGAHQIHGLTRCLGFRRVHGQSRYLGVHRVPPRLMLSNGSGFRDNVKSDCWKRVQALLLSPMTAPVGSLATGVWVALRTILGQMPVFPAFETTTVALQLLPLCLVQFLPSIIHSRGDFGRIRCINRIPLATTREIRAPASCSCRPNCLRQVFWMFTHSIGSKIIRKTSNEQQRLRKFIDVGNT